MKVLHSAQDFFLSLRLCISIAVFLHETSTHQLFHINLPHRHVRHWIRLNKLKYNEITTVDSKYGDTRARISLCRYPKSTFLLSLFLLFTSRFVHTQVKVFFALFVFVVL